MEGERDDTLMEPFAAQEFFVDGFTDHSVDNGIFSCVGYRIQRSAGNPCQKIAVLRIAMPANKLTEAISRAQAAFNAPKEDLLLVIPSGRH